MSKEVSWTRSGFYSGNFLFYGLLSIVFFLAQIIFLPCSFAQKGSIQKTENNFRAIHWGVEEGMSQGVVDDVIKDVNGFLWIGTQHGLNRFDGSNFKKYFADKTKRNKTISGNNIGGLVEDSLHNIWIGTDKGVSIFDIREDTFRNLFSVPVTRSSGSNVIPFWATKDEVFCWDYPESQLAAYDVHTYLKRTLVKISPADSVGNGVSDHYPVFDGRSNSIWLEKGFGGSVCGLLQISLTTGGKKEFTWSCYKKIPNHSHSFEGMRYDRRRNSIWINNPDGLLEFTLDDRQFHHIDALNEFDKRKDFWLWAGISIDRLGRIWIGTSDGIIIYDPAKHSIHLPFPYDSLLQRNITDANVLVYCDRDGIGWSGSWSAKGIYQVIPFSPAVIHYISDPKRSNSLSDDFTHDCMDDGKGRIWINAGDVINIFDTNTGFFRQLLKKDLKGTMGERKEVTVAFIDTINQKAYINADGLYRMDMATNQCVRIMFKDSNNQIIPLLSGGFPTPYQNTCIFTTYFNGQEGIFILEEDSAVVRQLLSFPAGSYFPAGTIDFFRTATDDHLIFLRQPDSTGNLTYAPQNGKWVRTPNPFDSIRWTRLIYNKADRTYWLAAEKTVLHYDGNFRLIRNYTLSDGLPDAEIFGMIPDKFNNIWLNTESAIFQLNIKSGRISSLSEKDGFQRQGFSYFFNFMKSTSGELYLTGGVFGQGLDKINPSRYIYTSSSVYLQTLLVNQKPFSFLTGINNLKELFLNYSENNITIETAVLDFYSRGNSHIRYKLGEKADWLYPVNSAVYTIHYEDLLPGDYALIIQASNASNEFEGPEKTLLFHISPPWWQTWWARALFLLAFIFSLWSFILYRSRNLKKRNAALEVKVLDRTKELKHSLEELRDTQTQLIQREKMASLGELTAGIAHEIQNPLNFVNNFSELNKELIIELKDEMDKGNIPTAKEIANDVMDNEDKINHHGKRADAIVKSMLQHSRSSAGLKEPSDINALADEYLRLSYHGLRSRDKMFHATIQTDFDETLEKINVIPQDIGRVLLNLFNNAFYSINEQKKLSGEGFEPVILVSTKKITNKVEIKVRDNGLGIPQKVLDKVYQPFFTTKAPGEGTGLGLSLSYDIITKIHGGELKVETEEGEFAEFTVILPI